MPSGPSYSRTKLYGSIRSLYVDRFDLPDNKKVCVLANGFIENGHWYQVKVNGRSLCDFLNSLGYDVHVLSFYPQKLLFESKSLSTDISFSKIVCKLLPAYHQRLVDHYEHIHYMGHSYGATLILAFLMGYEPIDKPMNKSNFASSKSLAKRHQEHVVSFTSLSGFYGLNWDFFETNYVSPLNLIRSLGFNRRKLTFEGLIIKPIIRKLPNVVPYLPTDYLHAIKYFPLRYRVGQILNKLVPQTLVPFVYRKNVDVKAFTEAITYGSYRESWETLDTMLSIEKKRKFSKPWMSNALRTFNKDLKNMSLPSLFVQGDKDFITPVDIIEKRAFDLIGSKKKEFITLKNTGHQDILTPRDPGPLQQVLGNWLSSTEI